MEAVASRRRGLSGFQARSAIAGTPLVIQLSSLASRRRDARSFGPGLAVVWPDPCSEALATYPQAVAHSMPSAIHGRRVAVREGPISADVDGCRAIWALEPRCCQYAPAASLVAEPLPLFAERVAQTNRRTRALRRGVASYRPAPITRRPRTPRSTPPPVEARRSCPEASWRSARSLGPW